MAPKGHAGWHQVADEAASCPDPEVVRRRLERFAEAADAIELESPREPAVELLTLAATRAPYLYSLLVRDPARLLRVSTDPYMFREKPRSILSDELESWVAGIDDGDDLHAALRRFRADEMVRLGYRELSAGTPEEVGRELANLADLSYDAAIAFHRAALERRYGPAQCTSGEPVEFTVIAMGKLGGRELNFSSDVDVIYAYGTDDGAAGDLTLHEFFSRLSRWVTGALGEVTEEDVVFRVDLRLRPEGSRGAIANSLPSLERYYESFGRPWERQAWLKARPAAGSIELGDEVIEMLRPFVYPRTTSIGVIDEVRSLNERIKQELAPGGVEAGFDVKNGRGGIREIEFFVQALQLVHGGRISTIRSRNTLRALDQLQFAGLISERERNGLTAAYQFLRHVEHLLQLDSGRQTQRLPQGETELAAFARRLGYTEPLDFDTDLHWHTEVTAEVFATLGDESSEIPASIAALISGQLPRERELQLLVELGFRDCDAAADNLERARTMPASPFAGSAPASAARIAPILLTEIARSTAPDVALGYLVELIHRRGSWALIWRLMDQTPQLARLVVTLFATSEYLSRLFISNPDLTDALLAAGRASPTMSREALRRSLAMEHGGEVDETHWNQLAEAKNSEALRIGFAYIGGDLDSIDASAELSKLADVCLEQALAMVLSQIAERHGVARTESGDPSVLAVLAMGKLGGQELGFASDLDVVFVYSNDGVSDGRRSVDNVVYFTRVAQRLMGGLHALHPGGRLYEVDTRLRPSGRKGLLVSSWPAWRRYHHEEARLWERQALTKLRFVAGDPALGKRIEEDTEEFLYGRATTTEERQQMAAGILEMRDKVQREIGSQVHGHDIKAGAGGLIDIEFAAQYLQLAHGHEVHGLRRTRTIEIVAAALEAELADAASLATMREGYIFLRRLEHGMRIVHDRPVQTLPNDPEGLERLAARVGFESGSSLTEAYGHWTREIRRAFEVVLEHRSRTPPGAS